VFLHCRQQPAAPGTGSNAASPRFEVSREEQAKLAEQFPAACQDGDIDGLVALLAGDAAFYRDGGNKGTGVPHLGPLSPIGRRSGR
jgi:hypothetical protein